MFNQKSKEAIENHSAYLGPSPLSDLVCGGAADITQEISDLFGEAALVDNDIWKPLEDLFREVRCPIFETVARKLLVTVVLVVAACWRFRLEMIASSWHFNAFLDRS